MNESILENIYESILDEHPEMNRDEASQLAYEIFLEGAE